MASEEQKQVQVLADIEAIKRLQYHYVNSLVQTNWKEILGCFAENGSVDIGEGSEGENLITGKEEIRKLFEEGVAISHVGQEGIFVVHPEIDVNGDTATGTWLSYFFHIRSRGKEPLLNWMQGFYNCKYVRENGKWKFGILSWRARLKYKGPEMQVMA